MKNKNILPHWFIQAIQPDPLKTSLGKRAIDAKVTTPSEDHHNQITINRPNPTNAISFYIPSDQSHTLANLDSYNGDQSNRPEPIFLCPYCPKFSSTSERQYQRHMVLKHPGKS